MLCNFKEEYQTWGVHLMLADPEHQEMNGQVEVTWRTLHTVAHFLMVHDRVSEAYIHFLLVYTTYHIFLVLSIKDMINKDRDRTTTFKLATGTKPSASHLHALFVHVLYGKLLHKSTKRR